MTWLVHVIWLVHVTSRLDEIKCRTIPLFATIPKAMCAVPSVVLPRIASRLQGYSCTDSDVETKISSLKWGESSLSLQRCEQGVVMEMVDLT